MRWWLIGGGIVAAVFGIGLAVGVVDCKVKVSGNPVTIGYKQEELDAKLRAFLAAIGEVRNLNCEPLAPKTGSTATCMVTFTEGPTREVTLVATSHGVTLNPAVPLADIKKLREMLVNLVPETTELRCQTNVELDYERPIACDAVLTDGATVALRAHADDTRVRWEAVSPLELIGALVRARLKLPAGTLVACRPDPPIARCTIGEGAAARQVRAGISAEDGSLSVEPVVGPGSSL